MNKMFLYPLWIKTCGDDAVVRGLLKCSGGSCGLKETREQYLYSLVLARVLVSKLVQVTSRACCREYLAFTNEAALI